VQKEAYYFDKPCLVMRDETEWTELVEHGANTIVGANNNLIVSAALGPREHIDFSKDFYGQGDAAEKIVQFLVANQP
jgi:UDP-GlcNAc3NAcA epimerase